MRRNEVEKPDLINKEESEIYMQEGGDRYGTI